MNRLYDLDVPVATSMLRMANKKISRNPLYDYMCYWIAFNNIYTIISDRMEMGPTFARHDDGTMKISQSNNLILPKVKRLSERKQIEAAFGQFDDDLKDVLIMHDSTRFFVYRTPVWRDQSIEFDLRGQRLNGVIKVGYTVDAYYPVWSPIDTDLFESYTAGYRDNEARVHLSIQILDILYTIRNNTMHAGKKPDSDNDREVVEKALPLLKEIVAYFIITNERYSL